MNCLRHGCQNHDPDRKIARFYDPNPTSWLDFFFFLSEIHLGKIIYLNP